ncbi:MAG: hypothetical protein ACR2G5_01595 [Pyrinomonadaceae bacterium]
MLSQERSAARDVLLFAQRVTRGATTLRCTKPVTPQAQAAPTSICAGPWRAAAADGRGRSDNDPIMCRCMTHDGATLYQRRRAACLTRT